MNHVLVAPVSWQSCPVHVQHERDTACCNMVFPHCLHGYPRRARCMLPQLPLAATSPQMDNAPARAIIRNASSSCSLACDLPRGRSRAACTLLQLLHAACRKKRGHHCQYDDTACRRAGTMRCSRACHRCDTILDTAIIAASFLGLLLLSSRELPPPWDNDTHQGSPQSPSHCNPPGCQVPLNTLTILAAPPAAA